MANGAPNVWTQMNYVPPRGECNHKVSYLSSKCACLRFMLHPLKSASSYECDGCGHHASFHSMENKVEDAIRKRWEQEAKERAEREEEAQQRPKKRVRAIEYNNASIDMLDDSQLDAALGNSAGPKTRGKGAKNAGRAAAAKAKNRIAEVIDEDDIVVELD